MNLTDVYYDLSEIFEDDEEIVICAIIELTGCKKSKSELRLKLEKLNLGTIETELNMLYDMRVDTLKRFCLNKKKIGCQTDIYDFL